MELEIIDFKNKQIHRGKKGFTIIVEEYFVTVIETHEGDYVVEATFYYSPILVKSGITTREEALDLVRSLLPDEVKPMVEEMTFEGQGYRRYKHKENIDMEKSVLTYYLNKQKNLD